MDEVASQSDQPSPELVPVWDRLLQRLESPACEWQESAEDIARKLESFPDETNLDRVRKDLSQILTPLVYLPIVYPEIKTIFRARKDRDGRNPVQGFDDIWYRKGPGYWGRCNTPGDPTFYCTPFLDTLIDECGIAEGEEFSLLACNLLQEASGPLLYTLGGPEFLRRDPALWKTSGGHPAAPDYEVSLKDKQNAGQPVAIHKFFTELFCSTVDDRGSLTHTDKHSMTEVGSTTPRSFAMTFHESSNGYRLTATYAQIMKAHFAALHGYHLQGFRYPQIRTEGSPRSDIFNLALTRDCVDRLYKANRGIYRCTVENGRVKLVSTMMEEGNASAQEHAPHNIATSACLLDKLPRLDNSNWTGFSVDPG